MLLSFQGSQAIKDLPVTATAHKAWTGHLQLVTPLICKYNSHAAHRLQAPVHLQAYEIVRININKRKTPLVYAVALRSSQVRTAEVFLLLSFVVL